MMTYLLYRFLLLGLFLTASSFRVEAKEKPVREISIIAEAEDGRDSPIAPVPAFAFHGEKILFSWLLPANDDPESEFCLDLFRVLTSTVIPVAQEEAPSKVEKVADTAEIRIEYELVLPDSSAVSQTHFLKVWRKRGEKREAAALVLLHSVAGNLDYISWGESVSWVPVEGEGAEIPEALSKLAPWTVEVSEYEESIEGQIAFVELESIEQLDEFHSRTKHPSRVIFVPVSGFDTAVWTAPEKVMEIGDGKAVMLSVGAANLDSLDPKDAYLLMQLLNEGE